MELRGTRKAAYPEKGVIDGKTHLTVLSNTHTRIKHEPFSTKGFRLVARTKVRADNSVSSRPDSMHWFNPAASQLPSLTKYSSYPFINKIVKYGKVHQGRA